MKFKVAYNAKPNMFGRLEFSHTLMSDDGSVPYTIDRFLSEVIFSKIKDENTFNVEKNKLIKELKALAIGEEKIIINKEEKSVILIERVDKSITMADLLEELH